MTWLETKPGEDIQQAINTQAIQTALEKSNTQLSEPAYSSYLSNANPPRWYLNSVLGGGGNGAITYVTWQRNSGLMGTFFDPWNMFDGSATIIIPVTGFYSITSWYNLTGGAAAGGYLQVLLQDSITGQYAAVDLRPAPGLAPTAFQGGIAWTGPLVAGTHLAMQVGNTTGANFAFNNPTYFSGCWIAPITTTPGGNPT